MNDTFRFNSSPVTRHRRIDRRMRRGAAAVEFAFVVPIFILTVFVCFDFARLCMITNLGQIAAYESARYAMVPGSTSEEAVERANAILARLGTHNATIVVNDGDALTEETTSVTVQVSIPMNDNSFGLTRFMTDKVVTSEITLIAERYKGFFDALEN